MNEPSIQIYIACLASYNNGILHGAWIDATQSAKEIMAEVQAMLTHSPTPDAEEWAIHDYEGFGRIQLGEYEAIESVIDKARFIQERGNLGAELILHCGDVDSAKSTFENHYAGEFQSVVDFAEHLTKDTTSIPDSLRYYIDYNAMARDLEINDIIVIELGFEQVHVFWQH